MPLSMASIPRAVAVALLIAASIGASPAEGTSEPSASPGPGRWPTSSELRAALAPSGYSFRFGDPGSPWPGTDRWTGGRPGIPGSFAWPAERSVAIDERGDAPATVHLLVGGDARLIELVDVGTALGVPTSPLLEASDLVRSSAAPAAAGSCPFAEWPVAGGRIVVWRAATGDGSDLEVAFEPLTDDDTAAQGSGPSRGSGLLPGLDAGIPTSAEEACGPSEAGATGTTPPTPVSSPSGIVPLTAISVEAREFGFGPQVLTIPASGTSRIVVTDAGRIVHNLTVDALDIQVVVSPGGSGEATIVDPPPGTYQFYCSVSGHKEAGMVGTLTVE